MCKKCLSTKIRYRICKACHLVRGPAPPPEEDYVCKLCDPESAWNKSHFQLLDLFLDTKEISLLHRPREKGK